MKNEPHDLLKTRSHRSHSVKLPQTITIEQSFASEVTVLSWASGAKDGHSSLLLRNNMLKNAYLIEEGLMSDPSNFRYVSFAGINGAKGHFLNSYFEDMGMMIGNETHAKLTTREFTQYSNQKVYANKANYVFVRKSIHDFDSIMNQSGVEYTEDGTFNESWGTLARESVSLPTFTEKQVGLNSKRIVEWCSLHKNSEKFIYEKVSNKNNCASVAWRALNAGGGLAFCKAGGKSPPSHYIYITPKDLKDYADYIRFGILKVQDYYVSVFNKMIDAMESDRSILNKAEIGFYLAMNSLPKLYTYDYWKTETKGGGIFGFRGKCSELDEDIKEYAKYEWDYLDPVSNEGQYSNKLSSLFQILKKLNNLWMVNDRYCRFEQPALVALSAQVCRIIDKKLRPEAKQNWGQSSYYS